MYPSNKKVDPTNKNKGQTNQQKNCSPCPVERAPKDPNSEKNLTRDHVTVRSRPSSSDSSVLQESTKEKRETPSPYRTKRKELYNRFTNQSPTPTPKTSSMEDFVRLGSPKEKREDSSPYRTKRKELYNRFTNQSPTPTPKTSSMEDLVRLGSPEEQINEFLEQEEETRKLLDQTENFTLVSDEELEEEAEKPLEQTENFTLVSDENLIATPDDNESSSSGIPSFLKRVMKTGSYMLMSVRENFFKIMMLEKMRGCLRSSSKKDQAPKIKKKGSAIQRFMNNLTGNNKTKQTSGSRESEKPVNAVPVQRHNSAHTLSSPNLRYQQQSQTRSDPHLTNHNATTEIKRSKSTSRLRPKPESLFEIKTHPVSETTINEISRNIDAVGSPSNPESSYKKVLFEQQITDLKKYWQLVTPKDYDQNETVLLLEATLKVKRKFSQIKKGVKIINEKKMEEMKETKEMINNLFKNENLQASYLCYKAQQLRAALEKKYNLNLPHISEHSESEPLANRQKPVLYNEKDKKLHDKTLAEKKVLRLDKFVRKLKDLKLEEDTLTNQDQNKYSYTSVPFKMRKKLSDLYVKPSSQEFIPNTNSHLEPLLKIWRTIKRFFGFPEKTETQNFFESIIKQPLDGEISQGPPQPNKPAQVFKFNEIQDEDKQKAINEMVESIAKNMKKEAKTATMKA